VIKPLTSLRFFFAFFVFTSHINFVEQNTGTVLYKIYNSILNEGFLGVSFFFILSGFILSYSYKSKLIRNQISFKQFWVARIARIYPLHIVTLLISIPLTFGESFKNIPIWISGLISNIFLVQSFIPLNEIFFSFNGVSWSISNEMFFYALFPILTLFYYKYCQLVKFTVLLLLLVPIGIYFIPSEIEHRYFYINPIIRLADFLIGIFLYYLYSYFKSSKVLKNKTTTTSFEIISILLFGLFFKAHGIIPKGYRYSCYYWLSMSSIILIFAYQAGYISKLLSHKYFVFLGEISFSFYLWHHLIIVYILKLNGIFIFTQNQYILVFIMLIISLVLSYISYRFIEIPCNTYIKRKYNELSIKIV
jgi:peptidoglycan/LPS O-acetylase OafA/YrhL